MYHSIDSYGEQPFWFWNGHITPEGIVNQIDQMHKHGVKGFFLHSRQGMDVPYLSESYLDLVEVAVKAAKERSMAVWLYDEFPYPSGMAGGELLLESSYRAKMLCRQVWDVLGDTPSFRDLPFGKVIFAKAYPVDATGEPDWEKSIDVLSHIGNVYQREIFQSNTGLSTYHSKRFFGGDLAKRICWQAPDSSEKWRIIVFLEREIENFKYFGSLADPLNADAMRDFVRLTHERYEKRFGDEFGKTILGFYSDEISPVIEPYPWSALLPELFRERNGYDLIENLYRLAADVPGSEQFLYDYRATVCERFEACYDAPIRQWCDEHGLIYTGEKPHLRLSHMRYLHIPGCDTGHQKVGTAPSLFSECLRSNAKAVSSAAHFYGDGTALCEAYHSIGWGATLRDIRFIADWLGIQGINAIVPHAFYYSVDALRKHDAPPSLFSCMPWWEQNTLYTAHLERTSRITRLGKRHAKILIADPTASHWTTIKNDGAIPLVKIQRVLTQAHLDYYIADSDLLSGAEIQNTTLTLKGEAFDVLILPEMRVLEPSMYEMLKICAQENVRVYATGDMPDMVLGSKRQPEGLKLISATYETIVSDLERDGLREISLISDGVENASLLAGFFDLNGEKYLYLLNCSEKVQSCKVKANSGNVPACLMDTVTGELSPLVYCHKDNMLQFDMNFEPFAAKIIVVGKGVERDADKPIPIMINAAEDMFPVQITKQNRARLGRFTLTTDAEETMLSVEPMPILEQLENAGGRITLASSSFFGCAKHLRLPKTLCTYRTQFVADEMLVNRLFEKEAELYLTFECGALRGEHRILLNGQDITDRLETYDDYTPAMRRFALGDLVCAGCNELTVLLTACSESDGLIDPLSLCGDFDAYCENDSVWHLQLCDDTKCGTLLDRVSCGLPCFSGEICYDITAKLTAYAGKRVLLSIPDWHFEDCVELIIDGVSHGARAWNPYEWDVLVPETFESAVLHVHNTLLPALEGAYFDFDTHSVHKIQP